MKLMCEAWKGVYQAVHCASPTLCSGDLLNTYSLEYTAEFLRSSHLHPNLFSIVILSYHSIQTASGGHQDVQLLPHVSSDHPHALSRIRIGC